MSDCRKCADFEWCAENEECGLFKPKPQTNYDRIISKTPEELAEWVTTKGRTFGEEYEGYMSLLDWLKSPEVDAQEETNVENLYCGGPE